MIGVWDSKPSGEPCPECGQHSPIGWRPGRSKSREGGSQCRGCKLHSSWVDPSSEAPDSWGEQVPVPPAVQPEDVTVELLDR